MGIYDVSMGKGIFVPVKVFAKHFEKEIKEYIGDKTETIDEREIIQHIVNKYCGGWEISSLGNNAFEEGKGWSFKIFIKEKIFNTSLTRIVGGGKFPVWVMMRLKHATGCSSKYLIQLTEKTSI